MYLRVLKDNEKQSFIQLAYSIMNADNVIADEETKMIQAYCDEMSITKPDYSAEKAKSAKDEFADSDLATRRSVYFELYALASCDGSYDETEQVIMNEIRGAFGISRSEAQKLEKLYDDLQITYNAINNAINGIAYEK